MYHSKISKYPDILASCLHTRLVHCCACMWWQVTHCICFFRYRRLRAGTHCELGRDHLDKVHRSMPPKIGLELHWQPGQGTMFPLQSAALLPQVFVTLLHATGFCARRSTAVVLDMQSSPVEYCSMEAVCMRAQHVAPFVRTSACAGALDSQGQERVSGAAVVTAHRAADSRPVAAARPCHCLRR